MKLKVLKRDMFFVINRLKQINKNYFICYNKKLKLYEMHFKKQKGGSFCFYAGKKLDAIALKKTYVTQVKNARKLFRELDINNKKIDEEKQRKITEKYMGDFSLMVEYASRKAGDVDFKDFQNFKWI